MICGPLHGGAAPDDISGGGAPGAIVTAGVGVSHELAAPEDVCQSGLSR